MRIARMRITDFKGIQHLEFAPGGKNVVIEGQNGTGKSTIVEAYGFAMNAGRFRYDSGDVEVEFTGGQKFRRLINGTSKFFVNGMQVKAADYSVALSAVTGGVNPSVCSLLLMPFKFEAMHWKELREILMGLVEVEVKEPSELGGQSAAEYLLMVKEAKRALELRQKSIPGAMSEIERSMTEYDRIRPADIRQVQPELEELKAQFDSVTAKIRQAQKARAMPFEQVTKLQKAVAELERGITQTEAMIISRDAATTKLREEYSKIAQAMTGRCPTCGAAVPARNVDALKKKLAAINLQGKNNNERQEVDRRAIEAAKVEAAELREELASLQAQQGDTEIDLSALLEERDALQTQIAEKEGILKEYARYQELNKRADELNATYRELGQKILECEGKMMLAQEYIRQKVAAVEDSINEKFSVVKFRMFTELKTVEEIRESCEATINGLPYSTALSTGERFKAAIDIMSTLQKHYGVELPVFIDDAESYTSNSYIEVPNQLIWLKAVEGATELRIKVGE